MGKNIILLLLISIILLGCNKTEKDNENTNTNSNIKQGNTVNIYIFGKSNCPVCRDVRDWLASLETSHPYLVVHYYEMSKHTNLYDIVKKDYNINTTSVPVIILGNKYYIGFGESRIRQMLRDIEAHAAIENCDVVAKIVANENTKLCREQNESE